MAKLTFGQEAIQNIIIKEKLKQELQIYQKCI
ncbi:hypothetical protein BSPWISOXPB_5816 [uncultured Gammaproteobacteria bacterium]|nr:hypothetical protein BSPWISOXPB_5816 [uncultured Gammaproteobacteria bacterium]